VTQEKQTNFFSSVRGIFDTEMTHPIPLKNRSTMNKEVLVASDATNPATALKKRDRA
jgi:hypothetical protein